MYFDLKMSMKSIRLRLLVTGIAALSLPSSALAQQSANQHGPLLWQDLRLGATPEEVLPIIKAIEGVKNAKVLKEKRSNPARRIDIDYRAGALQIVGLPFELGPIFENGRLKQILLASRNQCETDAMGVYAKLSEGLKAKYSSQLTAPEIKQRDFDEAEYKSLQSGEPQGLATAFANEEVAVMLAFQIKVESPIAYPSAYNKLAIALWRLASQQYENRKSECSGTGDRRMDVSIIYMTRASYDAALISSADETKSKQKETIDKL